MTAVRGARSQDEVAAALALRHLVFVVEQGVPTHLELDGRDGEAAHLVAIAGGRVVGTCRLLHAYEPGTTKLGRLAVERPARGRGVAGKLLGAAEEAARSAGDTRIVLDAQLDALGLYERTGYLGHGEVFLDAGLEHLRMAKDLS